MRRARNVAHAARCDTVHGTAPQLRHRHTGSQELVVTARRLCAAATRSYGRLRTKIRTKQAANRGVNSQQVLRNTCAGGQFEGIRRRRTVREAPNTFPGRRPIRPTP